MNLLVQKLSTSAEEMRTHRMYMQVLEELRGAITTGARIELAPSTRQHLEATGSSLVTEISVNAQHAATSSNASQHLQLIRTVAEQASVKLFSLLQLKRAPTSTKGSPGGPYPLLVIVDTLSRLWLVTIDGDVALEAQDLGHPPSAAVERLTLSLSQDSHYIMTADTNGEMRVHDLKIVAVPDKSQENSTTSSDERGKKKKKAENVPRKLQATANFSSSFFLPTSDEGEVRHLTAIHAVERTSQTYFVVGDSDGGLSVFHKNGTLKGRTVVTTDPGGVKGIIRGQSQSLLFWSSHLFGFFSAFQADMQQAPCSGWSSPLHDVVMEPSSSSNRVILALEDGDVLVFTTLKGKSKVCDLSMKFPHMSSAPFQLGLLKGHVLGLTQPADAGADRLRELFFFNLIGMEQGYGSAPSRAVTLQANFKPDQPSHFVMFTKAAGSGSERAKVQLYLHMLGKGGLAVYDLNLKAAAQKVASGDASEDSGLSYWLNWVPKIGVFGVAIIGVLIWNVRKATNKKQQQSSSSFDFDNEAFAEKILESRRRRKEEGGGLGVDKKLVEEMDEMEPMDD